MRILILTSIPFWHPGTNELIDLLGKRSIPVDALDIFHGRFINCDGQQVELVKLPDFLKRIYLKIFRKRLLKKIAVNYDIVDIHFVEPFYSKYVLDLPNKLVCTLFGSDLFRTTDAQKQMQFPLFEKADGIILSQNMLTYFETHFKPYPSKYNFCQYGSKRLDLVARINRSQEKSTIKYIACGYNNKHQQQHLKILEELEPLPEDWKKRIHLIFPMTYGDDDANKFAVQNRLKELDFSFTIYEERLNDSEIIDLWLRSDVMINTQTTDALASSIKEAFAAGTVLLIGEWLPYSIYKDLGIYYKTITFVSLREELIKCLNNLDEEKQKSADNRDKILEFASWSSLIEDWIKVYNNVLSGRK
jgi:glycosyltransferase involved in cell wall biosynthesis